MTSETILETMPHYPSVEDGIAALLDEIRLAMQWRKPASLIAIHRQPGTQSRAIEALTQALAKDGARLYVLNANEITLDEFLQMTRQNNEPEPKVYLIENFMAHDSPGASQTWLAFGAHQEELDHQPAQIIFSMGEQNLVKLVRDFPAFWENRYRVIDFTGASEETLAHEPTTTANAPDSEDLGAALTREARENLMSGVLEWKNHDLESACQYLQNAVELAEVASDANLQIECYTALALALMEKDATTEAIDAYQKIVELNPASALPWNNLGNLYLRLRHYEQAEHAFRQALEHNPTNPVSWAGLADLRTQTGRHREAIRAYQKALQSAPEYKEAWFGLALTLEALGHPAKATKAYKMVLQKDPAYVEAWLRLARLYHRKHKVQDALGILHKALEYSAHSFELWAELGRLAEGQDKALAAEAYKKALAINPRHGKTYCLLARVHKEMGNNLDAINCYEIGINFLEEDHERAAAWGDLLSLLAESVPPVAAAPEPEVLAEAALERIEIQADPTPTLTPAEAPEWLEIPETTGAPAPLIQPIQPLNFEAEKEDLRPGETPIAVLENLPELFENEPLSAPAWFTNPQRLEQELRYVSMLRTARSRHEQIKLLSDALLESPRAEFWQPRKKVRQGVARKTEEFAQPAALPESGPADQPVLYQAEELELDDFLPRVEHEKESRAWIRQGKRLLKQGLYDDALSAFTAAIQAAPSLGEPYINLGVTYFLKSKYEQAIIQFYKGIELTRDLEQKSLAWNYIGDAYRRLHDRDNALRAYQKVSELNRSANPLRQRARQVLAFGN
jgi:tetratricopeptide (TPR) repeat protein